MKERYPDRFVVFANLHFDGIDDPDRGAFAAAQFERDVEAGAQGLKISKNLGMTLTDSAGNRIATDDHRFDPVWAKAGELGIPVLIHTGDPKQFWEPQDRFNERWFVLKERPRRIRPPDRFSPWERDHERTMERVQTALQHHVYLGSPRLAGGRSPRSGRLSDELPNMHAEIGAVLAELGRQSRFAEERFISVQIGCCWGRTRGIQRSTSCTSAWKLYGLELPDEVLRKLYYENAVRLIPGLETSQIR